MQEEIEAITQNDEQAEAATQWPVDDVVDAETFLALVKREDERPCDHGLRDFLSILR